MAEKKKTTAQDETTAPEETSAKAEANAEAEAILEAARKEAAEIVAKAKADAQAAAQAAVEAAKEAAPKQEDLVSIRLFKDNERYKDDVFVAVNGKSWQIKRGETVQVPRYVADVLEQSMRQDTATANMIEQESSRYEAEAKARGV